MPILLTDLLGALAAPVLFGALAYAAWLAAAVLVQPGPPGPSAGEGSTSARWSAAVVIAAWTATALFWLLAPLGLFRLTVVLPTVALAALLLHRQRSERGDRPSPAALVRADLARLREVGREVFSGAAGWAVGALLAVVGVRWVRGTAAPPLGWDSITYHLYKAGRWVQTGDLAFQPAPDAWRYYEYYPVVGDLFWSWAMLPLRSDALITTAGTAVWLALVLGVYATGRELGAPPRRAALASAAVGSLPSVLAYLSSGYVDDTVAALFALGALFAIRVWRRGTVAEAPLAVGALALMLGAKLTAAGFFLLGAALSTAGVVRARGVAGGARTKRIVLLLCVLAAAAGYPSYQRTWVEQGTPFYPFPIAFGGMVLSEGIDSAQAIADEIRSWEGYAFESPLSFWRYFLSAPSASGSFLNPGPGLVLIALLALLGLGATLRRRGVAARSGRSTVPALFLAACAVVMTLGFLSGNMEIFRTTLKVTTAGRYVIVGVVAAAMLGAAWAGRLAETFWIVAIVPGVFLSFPRGWAAEEAVPDALVVLLSAAVAGGLFGAARWWRQRPAGSHALPAALALAVVVVGLVALEAVRREYRYRLYAATVDSASPLLHMHSLLPRYSAAWPIWRALDDWQRRGTHRIAVTAGWDGIGHNWYRYPLLGSRLQNRVLYVPVTADGSIVDYREADEVARRASLPAWLARLIDEEVDHVVSLAPRTTIEDHWMRQLTGLFEPIAEVPGDFHAAYRFDREAAMAALTAAAGSQGEPGGVGSPAGPVGPNE